MIIGIYLESSWCYDKPDKKIGEICKIMCPTGYIVTIKEKQYPVCGKWSLFTVKQYARQLANIQHSLDGVYFKKVVIPTAKKR
jgi:hypothetical protein